MMIPGISIKNRERANRQPMACISKISMGIFVVDHAPINISMFVKPAPFFMRTAATGKAPYKGPAAAEPNANAISLPLKPEFSPINFMRVSLVHLGISSVKYRPVKVPCVKKIRVVHEKTRLLT